MIVKGFSISRGSAHATHLMKMEENEHVRLHEVRGFISDNLHGAFKEAQAVARGTKCQQYLFSCVFSPPESANLSDTQFMAAVERTEEALGLGGQPRAVVFHEKDGRRHAHCVWSRIDAQTMKARQLAHFKMKLGDVSRELHKEFGIEMPRGLKDKEERDPLNFSQAEWQAAKRAGEDPRWRKETVQACWAKSDDRRSFENALEANSLFLARGDKRGFVVVDFNGDAQALSRLLGGKTKDVKAKLGSEPPQRSVADVQKLIAQRTSMTARAKIEASRERFQKRESALKGYRTEMTELHRAERAKLDSVHTKAWLNGVKERQTRLPRGVRGLWSWITGKSTAIKAANEQEAKAQKERAERERHDLAERQRQERRVLQEKMRELRNSQALALKTLRRDLAPHLHGQREATRGREALTAGLSLKLER